MASLFDIAPPLIASGSLPFLPLASRTLLSDRSASEQDHLVPRSDGYLEYTFDAIPDRDCQLADVTQPAALGDPVVAPARGHCEANAIAQQIEDVFMARPMTHNLLRNLISDLGGKVDRVVVTDLRENTFFATTHLTVKGEQVAVDLRPSDAVALVLRSRSPVLVEEQVIEAAKTGDFVLERVGDDRLKGRLGSLDPDEPGKYHLRTVGRLTWRPSSISHLL